MWQFLKRLFGGPKAPEPVMLSIKAMEYNAFVLDKQRQEAITRILWLLRQNRLRCQVTMNLPKRQGDTWAEQLFNRAVRERGERR